MSANTLLREREVEVDASVSSWRLVGVCELAEVLHQPRDRLARSHAAADPKRGAHRSGFARDVLRQGGHIGEVAPVRVADRTCERRSRDDDLHDQPPSHRLARAVNLDEPVVGAVAHDAHRHLVRTDAESSVHDASAGADAGNAHILARFGVDDQVGIERVVVRPRRGAGGHRGEVVVVHAKRVVASHAIERFEPFEGRRRRSERLVVAADLRAPRLAVGHEDVVVRSGTVCGVRRRGEPARIGRGHNTARRANRGR